MDIVVLVPDGAAVQDEESGSQQPICKACATCTRKKARCPGGQPCARCFRNGETCEYVVSKRRGPKKGAKAAASAPSVVSDIGGQPPKRPRVESPLNEQPAELVQTYNVPSAVEPSFPPPLNRSHSHALVDKLYAADGASLIEFSNLLDHPAEPGHHATTSPSAQSSLHESLVSYSPEALLAPLQITPQIEESLLSTYWSFVHPIWPALYRPSFDITLVRQSPALYHALLSLAAGRNINVIALFSNGEGLSAPANLTIGVELMERAKMHIEYNTPSLQTVQALFLLALRDIAGGRTAQAWLFTGTATRMAIELDLHSESTLLRRGCSATQIQEASRVIWCLYVLDKYLAVLLDRPAMLLFDDFDMPLPSTYESDELSFWVTDARAHLPTDVLALFRDAKGHVLSNFHELCKLSQILERIVKSLYSKKKANEAVRLQSLTDLHKALMGWKEGYNPILGSFADHSVSGRPILPHMVYVRGWFHACLILCHRPFIPLEAASKRQGVTFSSSAVCQAAANDLSSLLESVENTTRLMRMSHVAVFLIFQAGIVHVANAAATDLLTSLEGERRLNQCIAWLDAMSASYFFSGSYKHVLSELQRLIFRDSRLADELATIRASRQVSRSGTPRPGDGVSDGLVPHYAFGDGTPAAPPAATLFEGIQTSLPDAFFSGMPSTYADFDPWDTFLNAFMSDLGAGTSL